MHAQGPQAPAVPAQPKQQQQQQPRKRQKRSNAPDALLTADVRQAAKHNDPLAGLAAYDKAKQAGKAPCAKIWDDAVSCLQMAACMQWKQCCKMQNHCFP